MAFPPEIIFSKLADIERALKNGFAVSEKSFPLRG
jgi:hypothetical protein